MLCCCFFFKQKTAYEIRISDWSSDVCSSDLLPAFERVGVFEQQARRSEPAANLGIGEPKARVRREGAQFLILVRREIDDEQMAAAAQHPARLGDHAIGLVREMERLMNDDAVDAGIGDRQLEKVALQPVDRHRLDRKS